MFAGRTLPNWRHGDLDRFSHWSRLWRLVLRLGRPCDYSVRPNSCPVTLLPDNPNVAVGATFNSDSAMSFAR